MESFAWSLVVIGGGLCAYFTIDILGLMEIPVSFVIYVLCLISLVSTETINLTLQKDTPKLIATNFHTTTDGNAIPCGDYSIFTVGDIDNVVKYKGTEGIFICPTKSINRLGTEICVTINSKLVEKDFLPPTVIEAIEKYNLKAPYRFGLISERQELMEADSSRLQETVKQQNSYITALVETIKGKTKSLEGILEFNKRIGAGAEKDSWIKKLIKKKEAEEKGDE